MIIYPAINMRDGNCVRLVEGDFDPGRRSLATIRPSWLVTGNHQVPNGFTLSIWTAPECGARGNQRLVTSIRKSVAGKLRVGGRCLRFYGKLRRA